jgi:hypothetical protein
MVDGEEDVPVGESDDPGGIEHRGLADVRAPALIGPDLELQPEAAGNLHLGRQAQEAVSLETFDSPEINRVADTEVDGVASAAAEADPTSESVEQPTGLPEPVGGVPPGPAADAPDRIKRAGGRAADFNHA